MKFVYPTEGIDQDVDAHLGSENKRGFYPIGKQFNWHGGLHVGERRTQEVRTIADGVIIAYRLPETSTKISEEDELGYSDGFVLIQHKYISPKGRELVFYSLYMNLLPKDGMEAKQKIPDLFAKEEYIVKGKEEKIQKGENLRSEASYSKGKKTIIEVLVNDSLIVAKEETINSYYQVVSINGVSREDCYLYSESASGLTKFTDSDGSKKVKFKVQGKEKKKVLYEGENLRDKKDRKKVLEVLKNGTKLNVSGEDSKYYTVEKADGKKKEGLIWKKGVEVSKVFDLDTEKLNKVVSGKDCNIPVKAGDVIGFSGPSATQTDSTYKMAHIEVFTDQDPQKFLTGKEKSTKDKGVPYAIDSKEFLDDTLNTKKYFKVKKGSKLTLQLPDGYKKDDKVKIVSSSPEGHYCKVSLEKQIRIVSRDDMDYKGNKKYLPVNMTNLQKIFTGLKRKDYIYLEEELKEHENLTNPRKVSYSVPDLYKTCWVKKADLKIANDAKEKTLDSDLTLYYKEPKNDIVEYEIAEDIVLQESDIKEVEVLDEDHSWYKIKVSDKEGYKEGYISNEDLTGISAHDWEAFGFKINKIHFNSFLFDEVEKPEFLNVLWKQMEKEGELDKAELGRALKEQVMSRKLSKLICYHCSEWGLDYSSLESEVTAFFDRHIEEARGTVKEKLEERKKDCLEKLEVKVKKIDFWKDVEVVTAGNELSSWNTKFNFATNQYSPTNSLESGNGDSSTKEGEKEKQSLLPFPTSPKVYHFHPIAFVEQMKMMENELVFPLKKIPLNHSKGYKNNKYKVYDYSVSSNRAAPFGCKRGSVRLHAGCDLYGEPGDDILAICDGVVVSVSEYYNDTWQVTIRHDYEIKTGYKVIVRYGEVHKNNILVKEKEKIKKGQKIAEMGLLIPYVLQPYPDKRGMLHFEMYTGECEGTISSSAKYNEMLYHDSNDPKMTCKSNYHTNRKFKRRKDLINPLYYLNEMIKSF